MAKLIARPNCGNSPKMNFIKEFNFAFARGDIEFIIQNVTQDVLWNKQGEKRIEGKEKFLEELRSMNSDKIAELSLEHILSHGKEGAASGTVKMKNGECYAFSDFYQFKGAKNISIAVITSYVIKIE